MTANILTLARIVVLLPTLLLLSTNNFTCQIIALALMIVSEVTDGLDGYYARKNGEVSDFGKLFDPYADSVYRCSMFVAFAVFGWIPLWSALVFFIRDISVAYCRTYAGLHSVALAARTSGKIKAVVQAIAQFAVVLFHITLNWQWDWGPIKYFSEGLAWIGFISLLAAVAVTVWSLYDYAHHVWSRFRATS